MFPLKTIQILTPGTTGGAMVLRVRQQVLGHLICSLRCEVTLRTTQQKRAGGWSTVEEHTMKSDSADSVITAQKHTSPTLTCSVIFNHNLNP